MNFLDCTYYIYLYINIMCMYVLRKNVYKSSILLYTFITCNVLILNFFELKSKNFLLLVYNIKKKKKMFITSIFVTFLL